MATLTQFRHWAKHWCSWRAVQTTTKITVETEQLLIIRRYRVVRAWCKQCGCDVDMAKVEEVKEIAEMRSPATQDSDWSVRAHLAVREDGAWYICLNSLTWQR